SRPIPTRRARARTRRPSCRSKRRRRFSTTRCACAMRWGRAPMPERSARARRLGRARGLGPAAGPAGDGDAGNAKVARATRARPGPPPIRGAVRILFLDVDATLTDGVIGFTRDSDFRNFYVRDGLALDWARDLGLLPVVISGRASQAVEGRMADLGLESYLGI